MKSRKKSYGDEGPDGPTSGAGRGERHAVPARSRDGAVVDRARGARVGEGRDRKVEEPVRTYPCEGRGVSD
jgi:hypothetical protein